MLKLLQPPAHQYSLFVHHHVLSTEDVLPQSHFLPFSVWHVKVRFSPATEFPSVITDAIKSMSMKFNVVYYYKVVEKTLCAFTSKGDPEQAPH